MTEETRMSPAGNNINTTASDNDISDLVIVGCGIAGLSAAVTALQAGLSVTLLERAPEAEFGGNSRWTEAFLRMKNDAEVADDFEAVFADNAGWNLDPSNCSTWGEDGLTL